MKTLEITYRFTKRTKNFFVYNETNTGITVGPLYLSKSAVGEPPPEDITVTVEEA